MTAEEFIAGIPAALTPEALARAVAASGMRYGSTVMVPDAVRSAWTTARSQAKAATLTVVDIRTPGPGRDAAWAAVSASMNAAGAYAIQENITADTFAALLAPWEHMTTTPPPPEPALPTEGEPA